MSSRPCFVVVKILNSWVVGRDLCHHKQRRLHKDSQSHPSTRMESKHACCPSLHLLAVRTTSARRLLASPAACSPQQPSSLAPATLTAAHSGCRRTASTVPLSILPPVVKALFEDDVAFSGVSCGEDEYLGLSWSPIQACDGVRVRGLSKMMDMGLVGSPSPVALMKGLMPPVLFTLMAHTHFRIAHLATPLLNKFF